MGKEKLSHRLASVLRDLEGHIHRFMEDGMDFLGPVVPEEKCVFTDKRKMLEQLRKEVESCKRCRISELRSNVVFGEGSPDAPVMFVGEAPGEEEDLKGRPFVGKAGKLLEAAINSLGWTREDVYIANILKCRPPGNRNPLPEEIHNCFPFLKRQIELIRPKVICTLGGYSTNTLLGVKTPISKLRGKVYTYRGTGIKLFPTFHPAFILRNPSMKWEFFEDLKKVKDMVEREGA